MKPLSLRLKAFGPFATETTISFERVFDGGLFLIHGRTGSGKTSILDGLCFSLFGSPSSEEREKDIRGLRSDLADKFTMTETELIFAIAQVAYRVHRIPTQAIPKKRGEGFTEHKGSAELFRYAGTVDELRRRLSESNTELTHLSWIPVAGKVESVNLALESIIGMDEKQFRQVVILPQGKFREFLSSSSSDRQLILEKLFQTDRYTRLQKFISTKAQLATTLYREKSEGLAARLNNFGIVNFQEIAIKKQDVTAQFDKASIELHAARIRYEALGHELNKAKQFEEARKRFQTLEQKSVELNQNANHISQLKQRVQLTRLWAPYLQAEILINNLESRRANLIATKNNNEIELAAIAKQRTNDQLALSAKLTKTPSVDDLSNELTRLRSLVPILRDAQTTATRLAMDEKKLSTITNDVSQLETEISQLKLAQVKQVHALFSCDEIETAHQLQLIDRENLQLIRLEIDYHQTEAARLAELLTPGSPCPVCGSLEHPLPTQHKNLLDELGFPISADTIKAAKENLERLRQDAAAARAGRHSRLEPLISLLTPESTQQSEMPLGSFSDEYNRFNVAHLALEKKKHDLTLRHAEIQTRGESILVQQKELNQKIQSVPEQDRDVEEVVRRGVELKNQYDRLSSEIKHLEKSATELESEIARRRGIHSTLVDEILQLEIDITTRRASQISLRGAIELEIKKQFPKSPAPTDSELFLESQLKDAETEIEQYNRSINENSAARAEVETLMKQINSSRSAGEVMIEFNDAAITRTQLEQSAARLKIDAENLTSLEAETAANLSVLENLKCDAERATRISGLMTGDRAQNKLLVPLSRFVLQSRFEEVLEQANRRLSRMSRGQFQLRRPALSGNLRDSQGLEIRVEDANAGTERHAGSLSGGESFMAALSLALGLADVVQADLGGVRLDSVLIDEGFGTLDSESLDLAMKTLIDLQAGGRMVGIISHVSELKHQVSHRLEVSKQLLGSRVLWNDPVLRESVSTRDAEI